MMISNKRKRNHDKSNQNLNIINNISSQNPNSLESSQINLINILLDSIFPHVISNIIAANYHIDDAKMFILEINNKTSISFLILKSEQRRSEYQKSKSFFITFNWIVRVIESNSKNWKSNQIYSIDITFFANNDNDVTFNYMDTYIIKLCDCDFSKPMFSIDRCPHNKVYFPQNVEEADKPYLSKVIVSERKKSSKNYKNDQNREIKFCKSNPVHKTYWYLINNSHASLGACYKTYGNNKNIYKFTSQKWNNDLLSFLKHVQSSWPVMFIDSLKNSYSKPRITSFHDDI